MLSTSIEGAQHKTHYIAKAEQTKKILMKEKIIKNCTFFPLSFQLDHLHYFNYYYYYIIIKTKLR